MKEILFSLVLILFSSVHAETMKCVDSDKIYKVCSDQEAAFQKKLSEAKKNKKLVLIGFGADWCPWCKAISKLFHDKSFWSTFQTKLVLSEVGVSHYDSRERILSGFNILNELLKKNNKTEGDVDGYPFLAVVRPLDKKTIFINTGDLEDNRNQKGH
ncbi:MAG: thioredoxin family protein, partial [Bdellovibrionales bacterium]|nr:thioredoxin family protein [Bdellovibrionales bacterium]